MCVCRVTRARVGAWLAQARPMDLAADDAAWVLGLLANPNRRPWNAYIEDNSIIRSICGSRFTLYGLDFARSAKPPVTCWVGCQSGLTLCSEFTGILLKCTRSTAWSTAWPSCQWHSTQFKVIFLILVSDSSNRRMVVNCQRPSPVPFLPLFLVVVHFSPFLCGVLGWRKENRYKV